MAKHTESDIKEIKRLRRMLEYGINLVKRIGKSKAQRYGIYKTNNSIRKKLKKLGVSYVHNVKTDIVAMKSREERLLKHLFDLELIRGSQISEEDKTQ